MTYILYTTIARAGGLDLLLGLESFSRPERQQLHRRFPADFSADGLTIQVD